VTAPLRLGCYLHDAEAFELVEPLGEHGVGQPGRALEDVTEGLEAQMQVADDQRGQTLSEEIRTTGDWAVLAVRPHQFSVPRVPIAVKSRFLTSNSR
jgi:hypothetical protein